ncbi:hypothetical protein A2U01_0116814, partial [Trifolium medium]|nr:hypothetical protein [Trifolium medium]
MFVLLLAESFSCSVPWLVLAAYVRLKG